MPTANPAAVYLARIEPPPKRLSYIQRRDSLEETAFRAHWSQVHSRIAR
ncbi:hypothetical protein SAMN04489810_1375 [Microbacterium pygmaeum]|uniref:EthD domain-containing protein n=1 Tax=Microbacterium pygmaeum TaxID=370764 RepID=A0A1G7XBZ5_9MICO|nr:hypothetical protein SAMN04489810_1375 [Microbacterium pygmaeum]